MPPPGVVAARQGHRRWHPFTMSVAALALAGAVVAFTAASASQIICRHRQATSALLTSTATAPPLSVAAADSATCEAWPPTERSIAAASALPEGWYWYSPTRRPDLPQLTATVSHDLDFLDSQIAPGDPAPVVSAARSYIAVQRIALNAVRSRTLDDALAGSVRAAQANLDHACGIPHEDGTGPGLIGIGHVEESLGRSAAELI
jgi:hypothetical protein